MATAAPAPPSAAKNEATAPTATSKLSANEHRRASLFLTDPSVSIKCGYTQTQYDEYLRKKQAEENTPTHHTIHTPRDDVAFLQSKYYPKSFAKNRTALQKEGDAMLVSALPPPHKEELILAIKVTKVNRKGKKQQRILALTNLALYNYKPVS